MSYTRLRNHFRRSGIQYRRAKVEMRAATRSLRSRAKDRKRFAQELVSLDRVHKKVWIVDECSTSLWSRPRLNKTW